MLKRNYLKGLLAGLLVLTGCGEVEEAEPITTIPTEPITYEDDGKAIIHAGYYGENKKIYIDTATTVEEAEDKAPDYEIETAYDYDGRKTEITIYQYSGEEKTQVKHETYAYDENGNVNVVNAYDETGALLYKAEKNEDGWHETDKEGNAIEAKERDGVGNTTTETKEDGSTTRTFRNVNNDVLSRETRDKDGNLIEVVECTYSANDRLPDGIVVKDGTGAITEEYYLSRGNMRKDVMQNRYFKMSDSTESVVDIEDTYDESSGLITSSLIANHEVESTIIEKYTYVNYSDL